MTDLERWELLIEGSSPTEVHSAALELLEEVRRSIPDAGVAVGDRESPPDSRSLAASDWGLILIALAPFFAERLTMTVESWVRRHQGAAPLAQPTKQSNRTEFELTAGSVRVILRKSSKREAR